MFSVSDYKLHIINNILNYWLEQKLWLESTFYTLNYNYIIKERH